jgi:hypothetical protein
MLKKYLTFLELCQHKLNHVVSRLIFLRQKLYLNELSNFLGYCFGMLCHTFNKYICCYFLFKLIHFHNIKDKNVISNIVHISHPPIPFANNNVEQKKVEIPLLHNYAIKENF